MATTAPAWRTARLVRMQRVDASSVGFCSAPHQQETPPTADMSWAGSPSSRKQISSCCLGSRGSGFKCMRCTSVAQIVPVIPTGAGKTFTLSSMEPQNIGMMPRAAAAIFSGVRGDPIHHYTVHMSYLQIYREELQVCCTRCRKS